ncbi:MAG: stage II sporulation protein D [Bacilli bacterium]|nr:stage II sporulation protein D [Bacilli bacterium]
MKKFILFIFIIIIIPVFTITFFNKDIIYYKIKYGSINKKNIRVKRLKTGKILKIPLEEYIIGVVAGEMPATFNLEALKAQAVASRTYVLKRVNTEKDYDVEDGTGNQVYIDYDQMKEKWKENYNANLKKVTDAVMSTKGEVIIYNNNLIDALFFSTSNGYTENSKDVFSSELPYLVSVKSNWDEKESPVFNSVKEVSTQEFLFNLGLDTSQNINIKNIERTLSNRIKTLEINGKQYKGTEIRKIFGLRSTCFDIKLQDNKVKFIVTGFGHGVGLSQYGSNGMAKEGYDYKKIIQYYYQNCKIKKLI